MKAYDATESFVCLDCYRSDSCEPGLAHPQLYYDAEKRSVFASPVFAVYSCSSDFEPTVLAMEARACPQPPVHQ